MNDLKEVSRILFGAFIGWAFNGAGFVFGAWVMFSALSWIIDLNL